MWVWQVSRVNKKCIVQLFVKINAINQRCECEQQLTVGTLVVIILQLFNSDRLAVAGRRHVIETRCILPFFGYFSRPSISNLCPCPSSSEIRRCWQIGFYWLQLMSWSGDQFSPNAKHSPACILNCVVQNTKSWRHWRHSRRNKLAVITLIF